MKYNPETSWSSDWCNLWRMDGHAFCSLAFPVFGISCCCSAGPHRCCRLSDWFLSAATTRQINHKGRTPEVNPLFSPVLNSREKEGGRALASERKMTRTLSAFKIKMQMSWSIPFWVTQPIYCKLTVAQSWILHFLQLVQSSLILVLNIAGASLSTSGWFVCLCY